MISRETFSSVRVLGEVVQGVIELVQEIVCVGVDFRETVSSGVITDCDPGGAFLVEEFGDWDVVAYGLGLCQEVWYEIGWE